MKAIVPPETPGTTSALPIKKPVKNKYPHSFTPRVFFIGREGNESLRTFFSGIESRSLDLDLQAAVLVDFATRLVLVVVSVILKGEDCSVTTHLH